MKRATFDLGLSSKFALSARSQFAQSEFEHTTEKYIQKYDWLEAIGAVLCG